MVILTFTDHLGLLDAGMRIAEHGLGDVSDVALSSIFHEYIQLNRVLFLTLIY